jgi:fucose permease
VFALAAVVVLLAAIALRAGPAEGWAGGAGVSPKLFGRVPGWVLVLGATGALAYWIEGTWQDWGALHLERTLEAPPAVSALGPALFAAAMMVGRLGGNSLLRRWSERRLLVLGAFVAATGTAIAALSPTASLALAGIMLAGAGCAVLAPTLIGVAGRAAGPHERATIVGSLTTLMYLGFLVGPAAVGAVAELATLQASLAAVAGLAFALSVLFALIPLPGRRS